MGVGMMVSFMACNGLLGNASSADSITGATKQQTTQTASVDANAGASIKGAAVQPQPNTGKSKMAIVYFSQPETDAMTSVQGST